jgi:endogenous inhibitor of DNA gyrase (YacG/DUF329 family)
MQDLARWADESYRMPCSERCRMQDLARWADESYRMPAEKVTDPDA